MESNKIRVLIVDDVEAIVKKYERIVNANPYTSVMGTARNGYEAVAQVMISPPDVVLMDIEMETQLAGIYANSEILKYSPDTKVIILTAHDEDNYVFKAFQAGAVDYLLKSAPDDVVIDAIKNAYHQRAVIHAEAAQKLRKEFQRLKNLEENLTHILRVVTQLTPTELDILKLLHDGMSQQEIIKVRIIETSTMKSHISHILKKFDRKNTREVLEAINDMKLFDLLR